MRHRVPYIEYSFDLSVGCGDNIKIDATDVDLEVATRLTRQGVLVVGHCEHGNGGVLDSMSEYKVLNDSAPRSWFIYFIILGSGGTLFVRIFLVVCGCVCACLCDVTVNFWSSVLDTDLIRIFPALPYFFHPLLPNFSFVSFIVLETIYTSRSGIAQST
jgi:hypothetical protein